MMNFQYGFAAALENIDAKTIKNVKTALLEDLTQKPENIFVEVAPLIGDGRMEIINSIPGIRLKIIFLAHQDKT